jgi:hypothetical protein
MGAMTLPSAQRFSDIEDFVEHAYSAGWTDGLPGLPPEPDVIDDMLRTVVADASTSLWRSAASTNAQRVFALEFSPPSAPTRDVSVGRSAVGAVSRYEQQRA